MDRRKDMGVIGTVVAVIVAVVGISVVWAGYTTNLTIKGSASAEGAKWDVIFKDLSSAQTGNSEGLTVTAVETTTPNISGKTSIENFGISVKTPGDFVSYTFKIKNEGDFDAKIDSNFAMPTPTCTISLLDEANSAKHEYQEITAMPLANKLNNINAIQLDWYDTPTTTTIDCTNITYTLTYTSNNNTVQAGDIFEAGEEKEVILKLEYTENFDSAKLKHMSISNLNITIPFIQK